MSKVAPFLTSAQRAALDQPDEMLFPRLPRFHRSKLYANCDTLVFIGAMEKLADQNLSELEPEPWVEFLLYDHPPIGKRLKRGADFAAA